MVGYRRRDAYSVGVTMRFTAEQHRLLSSAAETLDVSLSAFAADALLTAAHAVLAEADRRRLDDTARVIAGREKEAPACSSDSSWTAPAR